MTQTIQARNITLQLLKEKFQLKETNNEAFFDEWLDNLSENSESEKINLDLVKTRFLRLVKRPPLLEDAVKLVVVSPLLSLAGFYDDPFFIESEESVEISIEDQDEIIRGRIDILVTDNSSNAILIENKIYAKDQNSQLLRYSKYGNSKQKSCSLLYLTLYGSKPSIESLAGLLEGEYQTISYSQNIVKWLEACKE